MVTGVRSVALFVRGLERVAGFYRDAIGLAELARAPGWVVLGTGGLALLELLERPGAAADDAREAGLFHTAFLLPDRGALGRWLRHAARTGLALDGAADHLVSEAVYLRDPEGNGIEVYADRPRAGWRWADGPAGPRVRMANAPLDRAGLLALADASPGWDGVPDGTAVGHVHLRVGDAGVAERFLCGPSRSEEGRGLGLVMTADRPGAVFAAAGGYHHHVAANCWGSAGAGVRRTDRAGLAFVVLGCEGEAPAEIADPWGTVFRFQPVVQDGVLG